MITGWNLLSRELQMGGRTFTVAPEVSAGRAALGAHVLVGGHEATDGTSDVITRLIVR